MNAASTNAQKYESGNPILQWLIGRFHRRIAEVVRPLGVRTVLDVGCGEGYLARHLLDHVPGIELWGVDASESAIAAAQKRCPGARFRVATIDSLRDKGRRFDLVVCSEVLEHLEDPAGALDVLATLAAPHALLTVPWEPWFQLANLARGKYLSRLGNHPEHIQRWTRRGFERLARTRFDAHRVEVLFPWTLFYGTVRGRQTA
ncbi:MAG TPA: methyltransferase domain-containing protein [Fredinandcohnia sp.]|nr:methyltransferase domain-containing protein [Fredinandcohnia sp.]